MADYTTELQRAVQWHQAGQLDDAQAEYERLLQQYGQQPDLLHLMGLVAYQTGQPAKAVEWIQKAVAKQPGAAVFHANLGEAYRTLGRLEQAEQALLQAIGLDARLASARNSLGVVWRLQGQLDDAVRQFQQALEINPRMAEPHVNLGLVLRQLGRHDEALGHARQGAEMAPGDAAAQNNLANLLKDEGQVDEAVRRYQKAINLKPRFGQAYANLAFAKTFADCEADDKLIAQMRQVLEQGDLPQDDRSHLHFALGKALDDLGQYDKAFEHLSQGNRLAGVAFDRKGFARYVEGIVATFDRSFFQQQASHGLAEQERRPIFIVGMPRSGTSLVEQVLASHAEVEGLGESVAMAQVIAGLPRRLGVETGYPGCCTELTSMAASQTADEYWRLIDGNRPVRLVDKMMTNYLHLGLIAVMFPQARIVHCRRDPLDTCWSCFLQDFSHRPAHLFDLEDLGFYYQHYVKVMQHWSECLPIEVFRLEYETLVENQEAETRRLLEFCRLNWDPSCLNFTATRRTVRTASSLQVRRPISARSVGRWRRYEKHLSPLVKALEDLMVRTLP